MDFKQIFSMNSRLTATVLIFLSRLGLVLAMAFIIVGTLMWLFADSYSATKPLGVALVIYGLALTVSSWLSAGFAALVKAASLYIEEKEPETNEEQ